MGMTWQQHQVADRIMADAVSHCREIGCDFDRFNGPTQALTLMSTAVRATRPGARAMDGDYIAVAFDENGREMRGPADQYKSSPPHRERAIDGEDLRGMVTWLRRFLASGNPNEDDRRFCARLLQSLEQYLGRGGDNDKLAGRAQRDMKADGRRPFDCYERDATSQGRARLGRDRRLARRAADRAPAGTSFLGRMPEAGSDLARMEAQAQWTYNL